MRSQIRKFNLSDLLFYINQESSEILSDGKEEFTGIKRVKLPMYKEKLPISSWWLVDLAYYSIMFTNDNRPKLINKLDFYDTYICTYNYVMSDDTANKYEKENLFLPYFFIYGSEQFQYQTVGKTSDTFSREMYILLEILPLVDETIRIEDILKQQHKTDWLELASWIYSVALLSVYVNRIDKLVETISKSNNSNIDHILKYIEDNSVTTELIRKNYPGKDVFYSNPYFMNRERKIYSISPYLNLFFFSHCIYWAIRNYYNSIRSQSFINVYGTCFEKYVKELLNEYVEGKNYKKIDETKTKRADWYLKLGKYEFFIEQKSILPKRALKTSSPKKQDMENFINKVIVEAVSQLETTQKELNNNNAYKVILLYDEYIHPSIIDVLNTYSELQNVDLTNDYFLINIDLLEMMLYTYRNDSTRFEQLMENTINHEDSLGNTGSIMETFGKIANDHIKNNKYKKYMDMVFDKSKDLVKNT